MTDMTRNKIAKKAKIAFHRLAFGLYSGDVFSRGKSLTEETMEYVRYLAENDNAWRNILKTKEQKDLAVGYLTAKIRSEFGDNVIKDYMVNPEKHD